ncbi:MAG: hypothetical protein CVT66_02700 [Actinobacteria bacterium HGW-Actinobacteria-6]|jgi:hypothetical protein|nr:MAG: hypothetical protein CVT66_02700 [Actinobacteria bacterium HGW-Actinobacteria-6]
MTQRQLPRRSPFAFGLTFIPPETLGAFAAEADGPGRTLAAAAAHLRAAFAFVPSWEPWAGEALSALVDAGISAFWAVEGPLWPVLASEGIIEGLRRTLTHPDEMADRIEFGLDAVVARARHGLESGASAIVLAEDLAGAQGPLVAPDFAIERLLPAYEAVVAVANDFSLPAVLHSDGDTRWMLGAVKRAGFAAMHAGGGLDFDAFERLFWAARVHDLAIIGGMQTVDLSRGLARAEVLGSRIGLLARAGGLLVADDGGVTELQQVASLVDAVSAARAV